MSIQDQQLDINALAQQVIQQGELLQQLVAQQPRPASSSLAAKSPQPVLHDLPTRPSYVWQPEPALSEQVPTMALPLFSQTLSEDERKAIVDRYPAIQNIKYTPPATLPEATKKFSRGQQREDSNLRSLQYAATAILRPLDVLAHSLASIVSSDDIERVYAILNDARTLVLHVCGSANEARNELAIRAINPMFRLPDAQGTDYTMDRSTFQETLSQQVSFQKAIREAQSRPSRNRQFFHGTPPNTDSGGHPGSTFNGYKSNHGRQNNNGFRRQTNSGTQANNTFRYSTNNNQSASTYNNRQTTNSDNRQ